MRKKNEKKITNDNVFLEIRELLIRAEKSVRIYNQELQDRYGITEQQLGVLSLIRTKRCTTLTDIAKYLRVHIATAQGYVRKLHEKKLIKKRRKRNDERSVELFVTDKGLKLEMGAPIGGFKKLHRTLRTVSDKEAQLVYNGLARLIELMGVSDIEEK